VPLLYAPGNPSDDAAFRRCSEAVRGTGTETAVQAPTGLPPGVEAPSGLIPLEPLGPALPEVPLRTEAPAEGPVAEGPAAQSPAGGLVPRGLPGTAGKASYTFYWKMLLLP
jgi:hypothetical protein